MGLQSQRFGFARYSPKRDRHNNADNLGLTSTPGGRGLCHKRPDQPIIGGKKTSGGGTDRTSNLLPLNTCLVAAGKRGENVTAAMRKPHSAWSKLLGPSNGYNEGISAFEPISVLKALKIVLSARFPESLGSLANPGGEGSTKDTGIVALSGLH